MHSHARSVPEGTQATATFLAKASGVLAGAWVAHAVFARVDPSVTLEWAAGDGAAVAAGQAIGVARGSARSILVAERVALNFLQRMSGIASLTQAGAGPPRPLPPPAVVVPLLYRADSGAAASHCAHVMQLHTPSLTHDTCRRW